LEGIHVKTLFVPFWSYGRGVSLAPFFFFYNKAHETTGTKYRRVPDMGRCGVLLPDYILCVPGEPVTFHVVIGMLSTELACMAVKTCALMPPLPRQFLYTRMQLHSTNGCQRCHGLQSFLACLFPSRAMDPLQCSPALNASQGITANPDISGIGVRTAIYVQAALSLFHPLVSGFDGKIDDFEILLPGCALLLSAIIQASTFGLTAYHAMIVLFLSWINNTSALTFFAYILVDRTYSRRYQEVEEWRRRRNRKGEVTELDHEWEAADDLGKWRILQKVERILDRLKSDKNGTESTSFNRYMWELEIQQWSLWREKKIMTTFLPNQGDNPEFQRRWDEQWANNKRDQAAALPNKADGLFRRWAQRFSQKSILFTGTLASTHLTLLSGFGWWFWSTLPHFGLNKECISSTRFAFFTESIPITSTVLRSHSKSIYIFSSLPVISILVWMGIFAVGVATLLLISSLLACLAALIDAYTTNIFISKLMLSLPNILVLTWRLFARSFFALSIITTFTVQTLLITITELTIARNRHLVQSGKGDWTFGQTLALTLTPIPLIEVFKFLWEKRPRAPKERVEGMEAEEAGRTADAREPGNVRESGERKGEAGADVLV